MRRAHVLLVEDDPGDAAILRDALHAAASPIELEHAHDGATALQVLAQRGRHADAATPDAILLDLRLPGLDGDEVLRLLKASPDWGRIPVVALTMVTDPALHARCRAAGAVACVVKPSGWDGYVAFVRDLAERLTGDGDVAARLAGLRTATP